MINARAAGCRTHTHMATKFSKDGQVNGFSAYSATALDWAKTVMALLGLGTLTVGGASAVAYGLFKWLGEKWIDQKFAKQMEAYKSDQTRELERLRLKINAVFDRTVRLHTREFEVLPDLWGKLVEAHAWGSGYLSLIQSYPDVARMDEQELDEYLNRTTFMEAQKRDIKLETRPMERQRVFTKIAELYRHNDAQERLRLYATALRKDGIFVEPVIKKDMDSILDLISAAIIEKRINEEDDVRPRARDAFKKFANDAQPLLDRIEQAIAQRLWDSTTSQV
ncbi:hypothetical protein ELI17_14660 [Rhizobium ruizarguesonis]|uniref:hypothetical protein n=1 Tax=Rhizobium ruizarguesonis TaxID=2081791 RepID=UPI00102F8C7C|nr:hypothetical protein [Rhizobium ruizarguesonis]TAW57488.1 hypothetical protein ELI17_14660 [Rhizobium ruizarguesonis]